MENGEDRKKLIGAAIAKQVIIEDDLIQEDFLLYWQNISSMAFPVSERGVKIYVTLLRIDYLAAPEMITRTKRKRIIGPAFVC